MSPRGARPGNSTTHTTICPVKAIPGSPRIPKGFRPPAQGCARGATLGQRSKSTSFLILDLRFAILGAAPTGILAFREGFGGCRLWADIFDRITGLQNCLSGNQGRGTTWVVDGGGLCVGTLIAPGGQSLQPEGPPPNNPVRTDSTASLAYVFTSARPRCQERNGFSRDRRPYFSSVGSAMSIATATQNPKSSSVGAALRS
jgi:hypothetical protein